MEWPPVPAETIPLTAAPATYVDTHLAPFAATMSLHRILRTVDAAVLRHDPALPPTAPAPPP